MSYRYSPADDQGIRDGFAAGKTDRQIAAAIGRTLVSVAHRRHQLDLLRPQSGTTMIPPMMVRVAWDTIEVKRADVVAYARQNRIAATLAAVNAFRATHDVPPYRLGWECRT